MANDELALIEQKKKWNIYVSASNKETEEFNSQKQNVAEQIQDIQHNIILLTNKNVIYESKVADLYRQLDKLRNRKEYLISQSEDYNQDSSKKSNVLSNATATFLVQRNTDTENSNNSNSNSHAKVPTVNSCNMTHRSHSHFGFYDNSISNHKNSSRSSKSVALDSQRSESASHQRSFDANLTNVPNENKQEYKLALVSNSKYLFL